MPRFKKTKLVKPYTNGKPTLKRLYRPGVYIIYKETGTDQKKVPVYVGYSASNVYKTLYRHFQSWEDTRQIRTTYSKFGPYKVRVILCGPKTAGNLERVLLSKLKPKDNPRKLALIMTKADIKIINELNATFVDFTLTENEAPF
jgi:hypothetical protein